MRERPDTISRLLLLMIGLALGASYSPLYAECPECTADSGDLNQMLKAIDLPPCGSGSESFQGIDPATSAQWAQVIDALTNCDFSLAAQLADALDYDLVEYVHDGDARTYYVLLERIDPGDDEPMRGMGTYVFNPGGDRLLNIQAPHAGGDAGTKDETADMFTTLQPLMLEIAGTHRCASPMATTCSGCTTACVGCLGLELDCPSNPDRATFRESDVAHHVNNVFQVTSDAVHALQEDVVAINVHGFNADGTNDSIAQISNGTSGDTPNSLSTQLAIAFNEQLDAVNYPGLGAGSWNVMPNEPAELEVDGPSKAGTTNVQGRSINDSPNPCQMALNFAPLPERFLHLEQQAHLRHDPAEPDDPDFPGVNWNITINAIGNVFPRNVWVDFAHSGPHQGHLCEPYADVTDAVGDAGADDVIRIKAGSSGNLSITISTPETLRSFGGSAVVGS